ncbi:MAG TPA: hypothetical protein VEN81_12790 [Planctomycetota bacterium]|nr:hypothetical protein [Planctomycetota bacterium]
MIRFLAVGHGGLRLVSENGTDWKVSASGKEGEVYRAAAFGLGRWVAVGTFGGANIFASSPDGTAWATASKDGRYSTYVRGLAFGDGTFVAIGGDPGSVGSSSPVALHSTDGVQWTDFIPLGGKHILRRIAFGKGLWVGVGDRGRRASSKDAKTFADDPGSKAVDTLVDVAFGRDVFVGVGLHGLRMLSEDGVSWTRRFAGEEGEHLNSIVWAQDRFVAVGQGATYTSPDGREWKRLENHDAPLTVAFGGGLFVGAHWKGRILTSKDGVDWTQVHKADQHLESIAAGG